MSIITTGTVLRSQAPNRRGDLTDPMTSYERYAVHAGEQGWIALTGSDAELAALLGFPIAKIEEDPLPPTTKERWAKAVKALRKSGVATRQNVSSCCQGCAEPFKNTKSFDAESTPYAWNFGGQGMNLVWSGNGKKALANRDRYGYGVQDVDQVTVYFNHGNGSAQRIVAAFEAEGFEVTWDGEQHSSVGITVPAELAPRRSRRSW